MKDRRMFAGLLIFLSALIVIVAALLIRTGIEDKPYYISVIVSDSSSARWNAFRTGLRQAEEDSDAEIRMVRTNRFTSFEEEKRVIDAEIASGADGIIMEPFSSEGTAEMFREISFRVPVVLIDTEIERESEPASRTAVIGIDDRAAGEALANSILEAFGQKEGSSDLVVGVTAGSAGRASVEERFRGLKEVLEGSGAQVIWFTGTDSPQNKPDGTEKIYPAGADAIAALDNTGLEFVIDRIVPAAALESGSEQLYLCGIGNSNKVIYSLDKGIVSKLIVPDEFDMGYRSVMALSEYLRLPVTHLSNQQTGFREISKDMIFSEENESYLFPIVQ